MRAENFPQDINFAFEESDMCAGKSLKIQNLKLYV